MKYQWHFQQVGDKEDVTMASLIITDPWRHRQYSNLVKFVIVTTNKIPLHWCWIIDLLITVETASWHSNKLVLHLIWCMYILRWGRVNCDGKFIIEFLYRRPINAAYCRRVPIAQQQAIQCRFGLAAFNPELAKSETCKACFNLGHIAAAETYV